MTDPEVAADDADDADADPAAVETALGQLDDMAADAEDTLLEVTGLGSVTDYYAAQQLRPTGTVTLEDLTLHHYELAELVALLDQRTTSDDLGVVVPSVRTLHSVLAAAPDAFVTDMLGVEDAPAEATAAETTVDSDAAAAEEGDQ